MAKYIKVDEVCSYLLNIANEFDKNDKYYPEKHLGEKAKTLRMLSKKIYGFSGNVEIVRCKDCKHRDESDVCSVFDTYGEGAPMVGDYFFCAAGERRETE